MLPTNFPSLLRWVSAQDPINTLVIRCESLPDVNVSKKDALLTWQGCLGESFNADLAAQLLASEIQCLQILGCAQCAGSLDKKLAAARARLGTLIAGYQPPKKTARHPRTVSLDSVPLPRRLLLPLSNGSPLDLGASHAVRTFQAYHLLAHGQRIENRVAACVVATAEDTDPPLSPDSSAETTATDKLLPQIDRVDAIHVLRCNACRSQIRLCPDNKGFELSAAGSNWHQLCPTCRMAVRYCPEHSDSEIASQRSLEIFSVLKNKENSQEMSECQRCRNPHPAAEGELCTLCSYEEKNPFSAAMPKEILKTLPPQLQAKLRGV